MKTVYKYIQKAIYYLCPICGTCLLDDENYCELCNEKQEDTNNLKMFIEFSGE
jgi:rubrerythrin